MVIFIDGVRQTNSLTNYRTAPIRGTESQLGMRLLDNNNNATVSLHNPNRDAIYGFIAHNTSLTDTQIADSAGLVTSAYADMDADGVWDVFDLDDNNDGLHDENFDAALLKIQNYANQVSADAPEDGRLSRYRDCAVAKYLHTNECLAS